MMKTVMILAAGLASLVSASAGAQSIQTITFGNLPNGNPSVTSYTENGFTFAATAGSFSGTSGNGAPPPSVYTPTDSGTASVTNGGLFTFNSVALGNGAFSGTANFTISGFLDNALLYSFSQAVSPTQFNNYSNTGNTNTAINRLQFVVTGDGNIDNIAVAAVAPAVAAVPEPAMWGMMTLGMGAVGYALRRRKVAARVARAV